jgi:3-deoxy-7-phosphoheptulonate synthase
MIDASHANSLKKPERQIPVSADIASQISGGDGRIIGIMIESHLLPGSQELLPGIDLTYGKSITDGCIGWEESVQVLDLLAEAVRSRRAASGRTNFAP